jgi:radical SAM protein with 4Fe4S-binding SPASM domain
LLLVNASRVIHLNPTASFMAKMILSDKPEDEAIRAITKKYQISKEQSRIDYKILKSQVDELIRPDGACPIHEMEIDVVPPFSAHPSAPYRMDCAITYRCNNDCSHCYNARPRDYPELPTEQWKEIIEQLWQIGIPHIVFTGGEPTLRPDLLELVKHAENTGQITGLNTNGRRLMDKQFINQLVEAGLDHVQITLESHDFAMHDQMVCSKGAWEQTVEGIKNAIDSPLFVMTNTTLLKNNTPFLSDTLDFLEEMGVPTIGLNALIYSGKGLSVNSGLNETELAPLLEIARKKTQARGQRLIWYTPTQYCNFDPMSLELGIKGCTAALYNMCIEPDGSIIPCQSYYHSLGNLLTDPWDSIWNHDIAVSLRERRNIPDKCIGCGLLKECGGGCPLFNQILC